MVLTEKIIATLSKSSSTNYVDQSVLHSLGKKCDVATAIGQLIEQRTIVNCRITKNGRTFEVYWLALQVAKPKHYSEVFTPEKRLERVAAKSGQMLAKNPADRLCKICNITKPSQAFSKTRNECKKCRNKRDKEKYKLIASQKKAQLRWCMTCKKNHPPADFKKPQSRRCIAATLLHKQNESAYKVQKNREWRARKQAAQADSVSANGS